MQKEEPLVVDLDGTLLRTDLLQETALAYLRRRPWGLPSIARWLLQGKAQLKDQLARATQIDVSVLPYNGELLQWIVEERLRKRTIVLASASNELVVQRVASHLQLFDAVLASSATVNLKGESKRDALVSLYGPQGFDYVANSRDDLSVWAAARSAYVTGAAWGVRKAAQARANVLPLPFSDRKPTMAWPRALRLHQWLKNLLVLVPLLAAHRYFDSQQLTQSLLAFICFGACASSVYVLNDLIDLEDDRHHATKRCRPLAAGEISLVAGAMAVPALLVGTIAVAGSLLPYEFGVTLTIYYLTTVAYSLALKREMVVDVITLATLYTLRVVAGAKALSIPLSFWLLAFAMFMFLSLALVKRYAELFHARASGNVGKARGRGYYPDDLPMISALGAAAGYMSTMVMALYINDARTSLLYERPEVIWVACPILLAWISRVWMLTHRGQMLEDPVTFAARDRVSLSMGALLLFVFWAAL